METGSEQSVAARPERYLWMRWVSLESLKNAVTRTRTFKVRVKKPTDDSRGNTLLCLQDWPLPFLSPTEMGEAGFFYLKEEDRVQCAYCQGVLSDWKCGDQ